MVWFLFVIGYGIHKWVSLSLSCDDRSNSTTIVPDTDSAKTLLEKTIKQSERIKQTNLRIVLSPTFFYVGLQLAESALNSSFQIFWEVLAKEITAADVLSSFEEAHKVRQVFPCLFPGQSL